MAASHLSPDDASVSAARFPPRWLPGSPDSPGEGKVVGGGGWRECELQPVQRVGPHQCGPPQGPPGRERAGERARETSARRSCPVLLHLEFLQQRPLGWLRLAEAGPAALWAVRSPGTALCCLPAPAGSSGLVTACHTGPPGRRGGAEALDPWGKRMGTGSGELTRPGLEVRWAGIMFTS